MRTLRSRGFARCCAIVFVLIFSYIFSVKTVFAAYTDHQLNLYSQNSIFFYDPYCIDEGEEEEEEEKEEEEE